MNNLELFNLHKRWGRGGGVGGGYRGVLLIGKIVGQEPNGLAIGAGVWGGVVWTFLLSSIISLFFLPHRRWPNID